MKITGARRKDRGSLVVVIASVACLVSHAPATASTSLTITIKNLPDVKGRWNGGTSGGTKIACFGTLNRWSSSSHVATITGGSLAYRFPDVLLQDLKKSKYKELYGESVWHDLPKGANCGFRFVVPGSTPANAYGNTIICTDFPTNDRNFRLTLVEGKDNAITIDASRPNVVHQSTAVAVNGKKEEGAPPVVMDPRAFTFPGGKRKCLVMSFDDGLEYDVELVREFNKNGIVGSFHLNSARLGKKLDNWPRQGMSSRYVERKDVSGGLYDGHEVSGHTANHAGLTMQWEKYGDRGVKEEVVGDIQALEVLIKGRDQAGVRGMSFPVGVYNKRILKLLRSWGVQYARTVVETKSFRLPTDLLKWDPTCGTFEMPYYGSKFIESTGKQMSLFSVWGHSYDLVDDEGRIKKEVKETFELLGGREDIWYASAIDVADYLNALKGLKRTGGRLHNPSKKVTVWVVEDGNARAVPPRKASSATRR